MDLNEQYLRYLKYKLYLDSVKMKIVPADRKLNMMPVIDEQSRVTVPRLIMLILEKMQIFSLAGSIIYPLLVIVPVVVFFSAYFQLAAATENRCYY